MNEAWMTFEGDNNSEGEGKERGEGNEWRGADDVAHEWRVANFRDVPTVDFLVRQQNSLSRFSMFHPLHRLDVPLLHSTFPFTNGPTAASSTARAISPFPSCPSPPFRTQLTPGGPDCPSSRSQAGSRSRSPHGLGSRWATSSPSVRFFFFSFV